MNKFIQSVLAFWNRCWRYLFPNVVGMQMLGKPKNKMTKRQWIVISVILVLSLAVLYGGFYYESTGMNVIPFLNKPVSYLPPKMDPEGQTYEEIINFVNSDNTDKAQLGFGFNCVDATFKLWRNATWEGIQAYPIIIQYSKPPGHMIIVFPTTDRGDVFIEPQRDLQVLPKVGSNYNDRKVRGFYVLDYDPAPLSNSPQYDFSIKSE